MILCFKLSMPSNNSWNGKWTGEDNFYAIIIKFNGKKREEKGKLILDKGYFTYSFGDGWVAGIDITQIDTNEANRIRKKSQGFCGYDWMVDSIISDLKIISPSQRRHHENPINGPIFPTANTVKGKAPDDRERGLLHHPSQVGPRESH